MPMTYITVLGVFDVSAYHCSNIVISNCRPKGR